MKLINIRQLEASLVAVSGEYDVRVPIALHDETRTLGELGEGPLASAGGVLPTKPSSLFFPQVDVEFTYQQGKIEMQQPLATPLLVVGFTAQDAEGLKFSDEFFRTNYYDDIYFNKRDGAVIVVVSGKCGRDGEFLKIAGGNCDLELICDGRDFLVIPYSEIGRSLYERIEGEEAPAVLLM